MALKHRITINVTDPHGNTGTVLKGADVRLPARLISFLFGDFTKERLSIKCRSGSKRAAGNESAGIIMCLWEG